MTELLRWLESNIISILLAVLLALVVWIVASQDANPVKQTDFEQPVPIQIVGLQSGLVITNSPATSTIVQLRAPESTWLSLTQADIHVVANLTEMAPGPYDVPVDVTIDGQAIPISSNPGTIHVEIEEIWQRTLPIQLVTSGELPTGYRAGNPVVEPSEVVIEGPKSQALLVSEVRAAASVSDLRETLKEDLQLIAVDADGNRVEGVVISPSIASVTISIYPEADFREVAVRVDADLLPAPGYYISRIVPNPLLVPVRGNPDILNNITYVETQPIYLQGLTEDTTVNIQLEPPEGVTLEEVQIVEVLIYVEAQPGFKVLELPVEPVGLDETLEATLLPANAVVSLSGPLPVLEALNEEEDILVTIDLTDLKAGNYQVEPVVEIASGTVSAEEVEKVLIESILPTLIEVEIGPSTGERSTGG
jgi:YbbR domain-containing protein